MPELIIKYKNKRTLEALRDFSKYFDFSIEKRKKTKKAEFNIKGVTIVPADSSVDTKELEDIFSNKSIEAKQLRQNAWQRTR